jgi:hypothetical protein
MPAPVNWTGTPTTLWASFPGGVGAPNVPIPLSGGARRHSRSRRHRSRRHRSRRHRSRKSTHKRRSHTRRR